VAVLLQSAVLKNPPIFLRISPLVSVNTALLEFVKLYIKSRKGVVVWNKIPEILQPAIIAQIPPVVVD